MHQPEYKRPHPCDQCEKHLCQRSNLLNHNEKVKEQKCSYCGKEFTTKYRLLWHISSVHEKRKDHKCNLREKSFVEKFSLNDHLEAFHNQIKQF